MKRIAFLLLVAASLAALTLAVHAQNPTPAASPKPLGAPEVKRSGQFYVQVFLQENFKGRVYRIPVPTEVLNDTELKKFGIPTTASSH